MTTWQRFAEDRVNTLFGSLVFLFTLFIYSITLTPTVPFWDGGEYIATSYILGVPHQPGTPLYVLIGRMFTLLPIGEVAQRVNWLSALSSSVAVLFLYLITVRLTRKIYPPEDAPGNRRLSYLAGVVGALIAAFATTFWDNAIEAEVYASSCALMVFVVWLVLRWEERLDEGNEDGLLLIITYLVGLGIGIHLGVAIAAWAAVLFVFLVRPRYLARWDYLGWGLVTLSLATGVHLVAFLVAPAVLVLTLANWLLTGKLRKLAMWSSLLFMVGVSVHIFLIIRANLDPMINEAAPKTWQALWEMLIRDQYKPPPVYMRKAELGYQLDTMWLRYLWWNFSVLGEQAQIGAYGAREFFRGLLQPPVLLAVAGAWVNLRRARRSALLLALLFVLLGPAMAFYLNFRVGEVRERDYFFVQNFMFLSIWVGIGAAWFVEWARTQTQNPGRQRIFMGVAAGAMLLLSLVPLVRNFPTHDRRGFYIARDYAYNMLVGLQPNAIIFTNGDNDTFPLWYLQEVEGFRKDVRVVNLSLLNTPWYIRQLRDLDPKVPIPYNDTQIDRLTPFRTRDGQIMLIKDIAVQAIIQANRAAGWDRPLYLAVTVPDQMGLRPQLQMEGLVFRIHEEPTEESMDIPKTMENLLDVYRYDGLVIRDATAPNGFGVHDTTVYKDDNATKLVQNYAAAFSRLGVELYEQGRPEEALRYIDCAQAVSPYFAGIAVVRGIILENLGRAEEAMEHYREMLRAYPNDWQLYYRIGEALNRQAKCEEAIPYFRQAVEFAPTDQFYPYQGLASCFYQLGLYQEAAEVLRRWLILHPEDQNVRPLYEEIMRSIREGTVPGDLGAPDDTSAPEGGGTPPR